MIKKIAWNAFKNTGNIDTYLELKQIENIEEEREKSEVNKILQNEGNIIEKQYNIENKKTEL